MLNLTPNIKFKIIQMLYKLPNNFFESTNNEELCDQIVRNIMIDNFKEFDWKGYKVQINCTDQGIEIKTSRMITLYKNNENSKEECITKINLKTQIIIYEQRVKNEKDGKIEKLSFKKGKIDDMYESIYEAYSDNTFLNTDILGYKEMSKKNMKLIIALTKKDIKDPLILKELIICGINNRIIKTTSHQWFGVVGGKFLYEIKAVSVNFRRIGFIISENDEAKYEGKFFFDGLTKSEKAEDKINIIKQISKDSIQDIIDAVQIAMQNGVRLDEESIKIFSYLIGQGQGGDGENIYTPKDDVEFEL